jgi:hypothetical protein
VRGLRTEAFRHRWAKELLLVGSEVRWTVDFFAYKVQKWLDRAKQNAGPERDGHKRYAMQRAQMCRLGAEDAHAVGPGQSNIRSYYMTLHILYSLYIQRDQVICHGLSVYVTRCLGIQ